MTQTEERTAPAAPELVTATIDGREVSVPKGTLIIRAAEQVGIQVPRFCDHPLLKPAGACRQCLVDVASPDREGNLKAMPKPQTSCTMELTPGMVVSTQHTSEVADKAQHGIMEFLLINHPLDCPVCDKGGECPLQNQAMSNGRAESRFVDVKRTFPKPIAISTQILLDRDRCILCQRCTRFSSEIAGDAFIALQGRGGGTPGREVHALNGSQVGGFDADVLDFADEGLPDATGVPMTGPDGVAGLSSGHATAPMGAAESDTSGRPFTSYFSGNTIQICPVGALTSAMYRFRSRPFDLVSTPSVAEHDSSGSAIRVDHRRGAVVRRLAGNDPEVNEEWITDKDRFAYHWQDAPDRLRMPLVRDQATGEMHETSWSDALAVAGSELARAAAAGGVGVLPGGRLTLEDSYAWSKFARTVLRTNDIDHRARPHSAEEAEFLASEVAATGLGVTYRDIERAGRVLLVALEPEEECGTIFLRLRKGVLAGTTRVTTLAPMATRGTTKMRADLVEVSPGAEAAALDVLDADLVAELSAPGAVILVGERAGALPGTLSAVSRLADRTGARLAWVPRRVGERGAVDAGLLPNLLPGGRPVTDAAARADAGAVWGIDSLPDTPGRAHREILRAAASGELTGLLVGGIETLDMMDP
ncbi:MAG: NADH-quinone oxidoreductase subunit G, partial [Actinomycetaceae bacterium]